jgi:hypothetical protein
MHSKIMQLSGSVGGESYDGTCPNLAASIERGIKANGYDR